MFIFEISKKPKNLAMKEVNQRFCYKTRHGYPFTYSYVPKNRGVFKKKSNLKRYL